MTEVRWCSKKVYLIIQPMLTKGYPKDDDFIALNGLADKILAKHQELNIVE